MIIKVKLDRTLKLENRRGSLHSDDFSLFQIGTELTRTSGMIKWVMPRAEHGKGVLHKERKLESEAGVKHRVQEAPM